jgi:hypothetical protein
VKAYLIILILALFFTCWLADSGMPPMEQPIGINDIPEGAVGVNKKESMIPDFSLTEKGRNNGFITKIDNDSPGENMDFPWGTAR